MKHITKFLVIAFFLIAITIPVLAEDFPTDCPKELMDDIKPQPVEKPIKITVVYNPFQKSIITTFLEIIGLEQPKEKIVEEIENSLEVYIDDTKVATIPDKSKFADMNVTNECLVYQYGTNNWYDCERSLL